MGYTHHWSIPLAHPDYAKAWPGIIDDTRRIIDAVRATGVVIAGPDGYRRPILDTTQGIAFNGDATTDLDYETFVIAPPVPADRPRTFGFCKTGRRPYDLAVATVLLRCRLLLPEVFLIRSTGDWEREWAHGVTPSLPGAAGRALGARRLVADLFGAVPRTNPLHPTPFASHGQG